MRLNEVRFAVDLSVVLGLLAFGHWLIGQGRYPLAVPAGQLLCGFLMVGTYVAAHELVHHRLFGRRRLSELVGVLLLIPTMSNFFAYRRGHMIHHRHTATREDPAYLRHAELPWLFRWVAYLFHYLHWSYALVIPLELHEMVRCRDRRAWRECLPWSSMIMLGLFAVLDYGIWFDHVLVPYLTFCLFQTLKNSAEHDYLDGEAGALAATRSLRASALVRRLWFNCMLHKEHHLAPGVPYHLLEGVTPRCDDTPGERIGYLAFALQRWRKGPPEPMFI